jgi:uncharacterized iron-regulated membrane protein
MKKRIKFVFQIHSWIGLITGLLLLVISLSGSLLVFYEEIDHLLNPALLTVEPQAEKVSLNEIYSTIRRQYPQAENIRFRHLPVEEGYSIEMNIIREGQYYLVYVNPYTGQIIGERERFTFLMDWLLRLHYSLFAEEVGEMVVAILGLLLVFSVVTGIVVYRKYILKVLLFRVPLKLKNWRQGSSELHRIVGVWSLLFNLLIALTGFYMLYPVLLPSYYAGKAEQLAQRPIALQLSLDELLTQSKEKLAGFVPYSIAIPSNSDAPIKITGGVPDRNPLSPAYSSFVSFHQSTGELIKVYDIRNQSFINQADKSMYSLHFGNYGGLFLKVLYAVFGLTPALLAITGFLLWWRQGKKKRKVPNPEAKVNKRKVVRVSSPVKG